MTELKGLEKAWTKAEPRQSYLPYLEVGKYELEVLVCKHIEKQDGSSAVVTEFKVKSSTNEKFQPGDMVQVMFNFKFPNGVPDARQFLSVCLGKPFEDTLIPDLANCTGTSNPLKGTVVFDDAFEYHAKDKVTKQPSGKVFTNHRWQLISKPGGSK